LRVSDSERASSRDGIPTIVHCKVCEGIKGGEEIGDEVGIVELSVDGCDFHLWSLSTSK
jgi:hypothetical protein